MKLLCKLGVGASITVLLLTLLVVPGFTQMVSKPGEYSGYSEPIYDGYQRFSQYVTVQAGTPNESKLAVDFYQAYQRWSSRYHAAPSHLATPTRPCYLEIKWFNVFGGSE